MIDGYSKYINNDLKKFYLFSHSDKFSFSHIDSLVRSVSGELFLLLMPPGVFADSIDPNIPIFNYGNKPELQELIKKGVVKKKNVYNLPDKLVNANSKVEFHKKTKDLKFVPKTVFTQEEALKLKFPIIAKPESGSKGEGIEVFKTKEDLQSAKGDFQVFSEKFDLKREFRIISINGEVVFAAERIPENAKANSLREGKDIFDREGTLTGRSSYKWVKIKFGKSGIPEEAEFKKICKAINESLELQFLGVDIGIDGNGKLWCIEANTCPGLNKDQIVLIYIALFKDFYKRDLSAYSMKMVKQYQDELMRANADPAKFSFSPHQGNRFYYYDDKVNMETGERTGKSLLTMKYNIEKSLGDTMLNIKKNHESKIMNFQTFLNESEKKEDYNYVQLFAEKAIDEVIAGTLKPIEVSPKDSKDKTKFSFTEVSESEGDVNEEAEIYLPKDESIFIKFSWSYYREEGQKSGNYDQPDDDATYYLDAMEIDSVHYYYNEGHDELEVKITPELDAKLKTYLEQFIPVGDFSKSYEKERKARK